MTVPFLNLKAQYETIKDEIVNAIQHVIEKTAFAGGPFVEQFENEFASFCQTKYAIGVNSGTSALWLALLGLGVGQGDEVITAPNTFIATAEAITYCGAKPVFVDIDEQTYNINPALIEQAITPRTKAIIPVHLFGQAADMDPILNIAKQHRLFVIEDACQAHGAKYKEKPAGSFGDAGCFSFYPGKNLGAYGEGGAVITNDSDLAAKIKMFREHGQSKKYHHDILSVKLKHLNDWNERRRHHARTYSEALSTGNGIILPKEAMYRKHIFHVYSIRVKNRDEILKLLAEKGIGCGVHYPVPLHLTKAYQFLGFEKTAFPIAEKCCEELVSLPMYAELKNEQIEYVVQEIKHSVE